MKVSELRKLLEDAKGDREVLVQLDDGEAPLCISGVDRPVILLATD